MLIEFNKTKNKAKITDEGITINVIKRKIVGWSLPSKKLTQNAEIEIKLFCKAIKELKKAN